MTNENHAVAKEGLPIILAALAIALLAGLFDWRLGVLSLSIPAFCVYFFRNPKRVTPAEGIIAPADGKIIFIGEAVEKDFLKQPMRKISVFMSPFNVHVNRSPATGTVKNVLRHIGKFLAAFDPNAGDLNERVAHHIVTEAGDNIIFTQVAGWFARRIVSYAEEGQKLERGRIFGLIKFGSRMDIYLPINFDIKVTINQNVSAGETILALKQG